MQAAAFSTAAASAASAASTLSTTQSTTHPYLHPKPRIGMTSTTKLHYDMTEQRFTPDDMQPHARASREQVQSVLTGSPFSSHPPWNASTLPSLTLLEQSTHFDDKHYAALQTRHLVHLAHTRLALIRAHHDPDADPRSIQPRWNVSSKMEDDEGHKRDMDVLKGMGGKREIELDNYVGLLETEVRWEEEKRRERTERQQHEQRDEQRRREARDWERKEQWHADTTPIAVLPTHTYTLSSTASSTAPPLSPRNSTAALSHYLQSTAALQPATARSPAVVSSVKAEPVAVYCHPGHYAWVSPTVRQWSCCHSSVHSIGGCVRVADAKDKVRLVRVGSEDGRGRVVRLVHGGVWDAARDGGMWSCCGSGERHGRGCQAKTLVREDRWNIE